MSCAALERPGQEPLGVLTRFQTSNLKLITADNFHQWNITHVQYKYAGTYYKYQYVHTKY